MLAPPQPPATVPSPPLRRGRRIFLAVCYLLAAASCLLLAAPLSPQTDRLTAIAPSPGALQQPIGPASLSPEQRGDIFMARKEYPDAVDYYYRALKQTGLSAAATAALWNKMGIAFLQQGKMTESRKAYKRALGYKKSFPEAWNNMGTTYFLTDRLGRSIKCYRRALALNPNSASFHANLGASYSRMKKYQEAVEEYRTALTLDPDILKEHSTTGTVVEAHAVDAEYFFYLAKVFASLGRAEDAVRLLRRAFEDGFHDQKRLDNDPDFLKISKYPSYVALRNNPPVPIKD